MFVKIGDIKLVKIRVIQEDCILYEGMSEEAPQEIKELNYQKAEFDSDYIVLEV